MNDTVCILFLRIELFFVPAKYLGICMSFCAKKVTNSVFFLTLMFYLLTYLPEYFILSEGAFISIIYYFIEIIDSLDSNTVF